MNTPFCTHDSGFPCSDVQTTEPQEVGITESQGIGESLAAAEALLMHKAAEFEAILPSRFISIDLARRYALEAQSLRRHAARLRAHRVEVVK